MKQKELNVRWHSRAGQGAVTAANFFAEGLNKIGYKTQAFPDFGAEKRGAPVIVYNRISKLDKILDDPAHIRTLDLVVLVDPTLVGNELTYKDILNGLKEEGLLVINTSKLNPSGFNEKFKGKIYHLNATSIALDTIGRNIPNVAMIGGLTKVLDLGKDKIKIILKEHLSAFFSEKIVNKNMKGFDRGYEEIFEVKDR